MRRHISALLIAVLGMLPAYPWPGMAMPELHVEGRWLVDENGNRVNLHGFGQTYSPWFNEQGKRWSNYNVKACLDYNKGLIDDIMEAGWKFNFLRLHMDPYWSNIPGVHTKGENDISAFDYNRFCKYLSEVFIPMAEYAVSKGLYVVMRPPGVCPEEIAVGDAYHKYLKKVWGYVSSQKRLTDNPHIMFELANEPVRIKDTDGEYRSNTDGCNRNLTQFFQEIVDLMRGNGCDNILWIPGTGYQSQYAGFATYPVKGENIGYAVHVYPGWYGSDAMEPSHELGGGYGGHFDAFAAGWDAQIAPAAEIAPIMVTEMDWAPSSYGASWGKSITGKMLGQGFGGNFKVIADNTGNVSWMIFTGPEWLAKFKDEPGKEGNYTFLNDPEACPWPVYHWFRDYAGEKMDVSQPELCLSPRSEVVASEYVVTTGGVKGAALIGEGDGFEINFTGIGDVAFSNPDIMGFKDGKFFAYEQGETECVIHYLSGDEEATAEIKFISTPFPMTEECFNPSIWETGSFDASTGSVTTGQYGFAGWKYTNPLDLSKYDYLIAEIQSPSSCGLSFRVYDIDNYWTDPAVADFGNDTRVVMDLRNLKSTNGRIMNRNHLYFIGFWTYGGSPFRLKAVFACNDLDADSSVDTIDGVNRIVNVTSIDGKCIRTGVSESKAAEGLPPGIYIAGGKKIIVR